MKNRHSAWRGFTLVELMVVIAVIGILIGGMFKLVGAANNEKKRAITVSRLEKLKNAIGGYYAAYGCYPPVKNEYAPLDLDTTSDLNDYFSTEDISAYQKASSTEQGAILARMIARAQPIDFEYPNPEKLENYIQTAFGKTPASLSLRVNTTENAWVDYKAFKFGVLSFLLPRLTVMGYSVDSTSGGNLSWNGMVRKHDAEFLKSLQWTKSNISRQNDESSILKQIRNDENACGKWLANFEGAVSGLAGNLMGLSLTPNDEGAEYRITGSYQDGYVLLKVTIKDGWGNELYYYSEPPYQSFRVWSSGPDGKTFPPWLDLANYKSGKFASAASWISDDIISLDR